MGRCIAALYNKAEEMLDHIRFIYMNSLYCKCEITQHQQEIMINRHGYTLLPDKVVIDCYYEGGKKQDELHYRNNTRHGFSRGYDEFGNVNWEKLYDNGQELK